DASRTTFADIAGLEDAKAALIETAIKPALRPELYQGLRAPPKGILLFGPPGNGKTMLAKAVANEAKCTFLSMSASTLVSKYIGDSEKHVRTMFVVARALRPTIIFLDEVDSILRRRSSDEREHSRRLKTQFLVEMEGATGDAGKRVLIMAATNLPGQLDDAAIRRFPRRVYIPMPSIETRGFIISGLLSKLGDFAHCLSAAQIQAIAKRCEGFSCSDMTTLVRTAVSAPVSEISIEALGTINIQDVRKVNAEDFIHVLKKTKPSVTEESLRQFAEWAASNT
ncbi:Spastin, partial [Aduncisulcus paluster]